MSLRQFVFLITLFWILIPAVSFSADWTVMVYMCADNNMSDQSYEDIDEMLQVGSSDRVKILVQVDNIASSLEPDCRRYLIHNGRKELLVNLGEVDMANPQTLIEFARFSHQNYSATNYLLILWDHGNGWPVGNYCTYKDKAIIYDQSSDNWIGIADGELRYAVSEIKNIFRKKIAILGFDACLMGMSEIASELTDAVDIMVASEEIIPWDGFPYNEIFSVLVNQPRLTPVDYSKKIPEITASSYSNGTQGYEPCTYSSVDLKKFKDAQSIFSRIIDILNSHASSSIIQQARNVVQTFSIENNPPNNRDDYIDLLHLLSLIKERLSNSNEITKIASCIDMFEKSVLANYTVGKYLENAKGIAVWFPDNYITFKRNLSDYKKLNWQNLTAWLTFLNNYYALDDIKPSSVEILHTKVGPNNDYQLIWNKSNDLSKVSYDIYETKAININYQDDFNTLLTWHNQGFSLTTDAFRSYPTALYSGSDNNLNNQITLCDSISLNNGGLLSFWSYYTTEESYNIITEQIKRDVFYVEISENNNDFTAIDSFYGSNLSWTEHRYLLHKTEKLWIRLRYKTDASAISDGVYLDDLTIYNFYNSRIIASNLKDTSYYLFNMPKGISYYLVRPIDSYKNKGFISQEKEILINNYCSPYSIPSPFKDDCKIYCDFPSNEKPDLYIYTVSGELIKKVEFSSFKQDTVYWNGTNTYGNEVASGLYLILLKSSKFERFGKIAKIK